jgi:hypothetical protein
MQGEATDPAEIPRERLRRSEAAAYARRRLGQSVKVNTLRSWPIPYRQVGRDAVYEISDLDRFIEARLAAAPLRRAPGGQQIGASDLAAVYETRRKLLVGNVGDDEAHLRAVEWSVNEYRRRTGADLETARRVVLAAIAKEKREGLKSGQRRRCERRTASQAHRVKGHERLRSATSVAQRREPQERRISVPDGQPDGTMA